MTSNCAISGTTLTALSAGTCTVTAVKGFDTTYAVASAQTSVTVLPGAQQAVLTAVATPGTIGVGATSAISVTGGSGTGALSYTASGSTITGASVCSLSGTTVTGTAAGICYVQVNKAGDANYGPASASGIVIVNPGTQQPLIVSALPSARRQA